MRFLFLDIAKLHVFLIFVKLLFLIFAFYMLSQAELLSICSINTYIANINVLLHLWVKEDVLPSK